MSFPLIGLTTYTAKNPGGHPISALATKYTSAIMAAGGIPVLIPNGLKPEAAEELVNKLDGILLTGGGDIAIERFGGKWNAHVGTADTERDDIEFALVQQSVESGKPFFGICRGFQVVNVALGGTLYTDIHDQFPGALKHDYDSNTERGYLAHEVEVDTTSRLGGILGLGKQKVNSLHHQGVKEIAGILVPSAHALDGLVEGLELPGHPFGVAVQWHPEWLTDQPNAQRLFQAFVEAASEVRKDRLDGSG